MPNMNQSIKGFTKTDIVKTQNFNTKTLCLWPWPKVMYGCWLCWGLTSQSTIFQSCRDGAIASWVINQYFWGVKCLAQGHNTAAVGLEPRTARSGVRHSTTEPPRSPKSCMGLGIVLHKILDYRLSSYQTWKQIYHRVWKQWGPKNFNANNTKVLSLWPWP